MHPEAVQVLAKRAKLSPRNPMIWNDLGVEYMAAGQPDAARNAFLRAHKVFPDYPLPLYNLGRLALGKCLNERERHPTSGKLIGDLAIEAIGYLQQSLLRDPLLCESHMLLATAYEAIGDDARATFHLREATRLCPDPRDLPKSSWIERLILRRERRHLTRPNQPFILSTDKQIRAKQY